MEADADNQVVVDTRTGVQRPTRTEAQGVALHPEEPRVPVTVAAEQAPEEELPEVRKSWREFALRRPSN